MEKEASLNLTFKTSIALKVASTVGDLCRRKNGTVNRGLFNFLSFNKPANSTPFKGVATFDHTVDSSRNLWFRLFVPTDVEDNRKIPVIVFFHGGGFVFLSPDSNSYDVVGRRFARMVPAIVVSVNYRLAPEHRYPAQFEDGFDILKFLDNLEDVKDVLPLNADVSRCILAGDSAGANLAHHVALRACGSNFKNLKVIGLVAIQPYFGGEERTEAEIKLAGIDPFLSVKSTDWCWKAFLPEGEGFDRDHEVINVSGPKAVDLSKLVEFPATLVVVAGFDSLKDWQMRYYEWLNKCGKEVELLKYPNMVHAFYAFPGIPEAVELIEKAGEFIRRRVL